MGNQRPQKEGKRLSTLLSKYDIVYEISYSPELQATTCNHATWSSLQLQVKVKVRVRGRSGRFCSHVWCAAQVPLPFSFLLTLPSPRVGVRVRLRGSWRGVGHGRGSAGRLEGVRAVVWRALWEGSVGVGLGRRVSLDRIRSAVLFWWEKKCSLYIFLCELERIFSMKMNKTKLKKDNETYHYY